MRLAKIIEIASASYPDHLVKAAYKDALIGDGLARFIAMELQDTYDPKASTEDQLKEAHRCIKKARIELEAVEMALYLRRTFDK